MHPASALSRIIALTWIFVTAIGPAFAGESLRVPEKGAYWGAYMDFGETEDTVTSQGIGDFTKLVGRHPAIIASSSYWGEQSFPGKNLELIESLGSIPLVFWSPWDKPYDQDKAPGRFSLKNIIAGKADAYIDRWGREAKAHGKPFFVSLCNEMNGTWFPWSGWYYGRGKKTAQGLAGPATFIKAYRHIIDRVRAQGATNIIWVFHVNNYSWPEESWNEIRDYYPGDDYVDWIGMSLYNKQYSKESWVPFNELVDWPYTQLCQLHPTKPIMMAEWGVGEYPKSGDKGKWINSALRGMSSGRYPRLKAMVFWHEKWENEDGSWSNLRVDSSKGALNAFRHDIRNPFWIDAPVYDK